MISDQLLETKATSYLRHHGIRFEIRKYDPLCLFPPDLPHSHRSIAKTLVLRTTVGPVCALVSYSEHLDLRRLARIASVRDASLIAPDKIEELTGYCIGGVSPFGMKHRLPTFSDEKLMAFNSIYVNGGRKGVQIKIASSDVVQLLNCVVADIVRRHGHLPPGSGKVA